MTNWLLMAMFLAMPPLLGMAIGMMWMGSRAFGQTLGRFRRWVDRKFRGKLPTQRREPFF
jgi:hypothetical protein